MVLATSQCLSEVFLTLQLAFVGCKCHFTVGGATLMYSLFGKLSAVAE